MTENKRFTLAYEKGDWWAVRDYDITLWKEEVVYLLNQLHEENEQLEKSIEQLRTIIDDNIDFNSLFTNRELSDICNETGWELSEKSIKLQQLEKENEQLKKAEILANHRGEMISFANSLIDDLGSETMKEMWDKFKNGKYEKWRNLE